MKNLSFLLLVALLGSCTITKRLHNPGWHVEWKNTALRQATPTGQEGFALGNVELDSTQSISFNTQKTAPLSLHVGNQIPMNSDDSGQQTSDNLDEEASGEKEVSTGESQTQLAGLSVKREKTAKDNIEPDKKIHPLIYISLGLILVCWILFFLLFGGVFASVSGAILFVLLLDTLLGVASFVVALKALKAIKKAPEIWKGKAVTLVLAILSGIGFFIIGTFFLIWLFLVAVSKDLTIGFDGFM